MNMVVRTKSEKRLLLKQRELNGEIAQQSARICTIITKYLQRFPKVSQKRIVGALGILIR